MNADFYKQIFDDLPEGAAICDPAHSIIDVNKTFEKLSGFCGEEIKGKDLREIIKSTKGTCTVCQEEGENEAYRLGELLDSGNKLTCIRINRSKTPENNIIYLVIPFSNIAFLNQAHIDFVSTVSHELRTPLTSIKGFADTLLGAGNSLSGEQRARFISIIKSQVDRLTRLVENLLTVSRLEARQTRTIYRAVDLNNTIDSILCNIQHKSAGHNIEVNILPGLPSVWADTDKLEQVLTNLVDNAVKYSNPGTTVSIDAGFVREDADMIEIKVKDQGFGIPQEHLPGIFNKFSRIDSPLTRQVQGTGLGLYITKSLVKSMNGDITVQSSDKGTVFTIKLPAASPEIYTQQKFQEI